MLGFILTIYCDLNAYIYQKPVQVQVDFDDKGSWEYLFKLYWVYLKEKLSLTLCELIQAKNPERESGRIQGELKYGHHVANGKTLILLVTF